MTKNAEVLVFASNNVKFLEEDENYDKAMLDRADYFKVMRNMNSPTYYDMTRVYSANYAAGDTVEMKTPGNGEVLYCVFVKEAKNPAIDTALTSISVDGVEVPDFDPEVKEYSVTVTDPSVLTAPVVTAKANSAGAAVEVIPATEFPGTTKIVVSHVNGGALRNYNVVYSKTFEAGKVNIPNGYTSADLYTIVIDYADYE